METFKNCYDFLMSPEPVVNFQKFCSVRPKYKSGTQYNNSENNFIDKNHRKCSENFHKQHTSTSDSESHNICQNSGKGQMSNGHIASECSGLKKRSVGPVLKNGFKHDINQNGTVLPNGNVNQLVVEEWEEKRELKKQISGPEYEIGNYFIFALFRFGAELGNEFFYVIFYTFCMWNFDSLVCIKIALVWVLIMYIGQSLKDVIRWPRPASPPVFQLEDRYVLEYGMPSTHAMVGTCIPFMLLIFTVDRYEYPVILGLLIAISWCSLVCFSRIYLGMHTIMDILAGLVLVTILLVLMVPWAEPVALYLVTSKYGGLLTLSVAILLIICYPALDRWSTARGDTTIFLGVAAGILFGTWYNYQCGYIEASKATLPYQTTILELDWLKTGSLRMLAGVTATVLIRFIVKLFTFNLFCYLLNKDPKAPETRTCVSVELPYKFSTYFALAVCACVLAPIIFTYFNINRITYYRELF